MGLFSKKSYFNYVGEVPDQVLGAIISTVEDAARRFEITELSDGKGVATRVYEIAEQVIVSQELPAGYEDIQDVAIALGVLYGHALCVGQGWSWKSLGDNETSAICYVISPKGHFSHAPLPYLMRILTGQNLGIDGKNDNTILLLYNMLVDIDKKPEKQKYFPVA